MALEPPAINGVRGGFESLRLRIGDFDLSQTVREINYSDEVTPGEIVGVHPIPVDTTLGSYKATGDLVMLEDTFYDLMLTFPPDIGYTRVIFPVVIAKRRNPKAPGGFNTDQLMDCRILKLDSNFKRDDKDGLLIKVMLYVRYITRNRRTIVPLRLEDGT